GRRGRARPQRRLRRHPRRPSGAGQGSDPAGRGARARARTGGRVGAAQGRRRPEVLHARTAEPAMNRTDPMVHEAETWTAHNYHPLPVVIAEAEGSWVTDVDGRRYLDCLAGYSALNFGHRHPALLEAARAQLERVTLTSRAFLHDQFGPFCHELAELC